MIAAPPPPEVEEEELTLKYTAPAVGTGMPPRDLPEPTLLATILLAVESDRRDLLNRVAAGFEEQVESVANLYWPFLVVHAEGSPGAAIFDVTGVWKQQFRYSFMPSTEQLRSDLDEHLAPEQFLGRMQRAVESLGQASGLDVLTVEGFLPLNPPLQLDLLSQTSVVADSPTPHAGFLPARHRVEWYEEEVARMRQWLSRLEDDLASLRRFRGETEAAVRAVRDRLEADHRHVATEVREQSESARARAFGEIEKIHGAHHAEALQHLEVVHLAQQTIAHQEASVSVSVELADRADRRGEDPRPHHARNREARAATRAARRAVRDAHRAIEAIHHRQREAQKETLATVAQVDRSGALALSRQELFRDQFLSTVSELLGAIDQQISARTAQKEVMSGYFLPLPTLATAKIVWLPIWAATLRSPRGVRQLIFPPAKVRSGPGVGGTLKRLFGGTVLPLEPRTVQFDKEFRATIEKALGSDPWLSKVTRELTTAANVLADPNVLPALDEGLAQLRKQGWVSQRQASELIRVYTELVERRHLARARREPDAAEPAESHDASPEGLGT